MQGNIRLTQQEDLSQLEEVITSTGLFPSELLGGMMTSFLQHSDSDEIWLTKLIGSLPVAVAYCAPERLTDGTYNLYLIAVHKSYQGLGIGRELMDSIEHRLKLMGKRILIVETSGLPEYELTRRFYDKCGYEREALIRDFYREGEDKVVFWKKFHN